jgi:hypothetical protein
VAPGSWGDSSYKWMWVFSWNTRYAMYLRRTRGADHSDHVEESAHHFT